MRLTSQEVRIGKMKEEDIKTITDSIKEKLGEESSALIADDLGLLLTKNVEIQKELVEKEKTINDYKDKNEKLVLANGKLLQSVPMGIDNNSKTNDDNGSQEPFNFKSLFDEKGNFKKTL